jgi:hypothetical protein
MNYEGVEKKEGYRNIEDIQTTGRYDRMAVQGEPRNAREDRDPGSLSTFVSDNRPATRDPQPETREVNFLEMRASTETDIAALEKNGKRETFWP